MKSKKELFVYGDKYRTELKENFFNILNNSYVISDKVISHIKNEYYTCMGRMNELCRNQDYSSIKTDTCYIECERVTKELRNLSIFSEQFIQLIYSNFYCLIDSFHPRHK